jgi:exodeoxyribonuclease VII large subunit
MTSLPPILTVSQLSNLARNLLEDTFQTVLLTGEISNYICASSGHWYFSLKDDKAQIRCAMFQGNNRRAAFKPADGMQVQVQAKVSLYTPRGDFQLIIETIEETGDGALQRAFMLLKQKLSQEGLFSDEHKQALPEVPRCIGVITSSTGAAIHDILKVLRRRCPMIPIILYPTLVQGKGAADTIAQAIKIANQRQECDVLIVGRGGGSLEDLWSFNEEIVARAIFNSAIPIVSAVGHEVDFTIADYVADLRAPTPSAAAELVSPNTKQWLIQLAHLNKQLCREMQQLLQQQKQKLHWLYQRLRHPKQKLQEQAQQLDHLWQALVKAQQRYFTDKKHQYTHLAHTLNAVSPLATLDRGYAIVRKNNVIIRDIQQITCGDVITTQLKAGIIRSVVI